jgi:hypothetical protein
MTQEVLEKLQKKGRGFENIKHTIERPSEIWAKWINPEKQDIVSINWLAISDDYAYCVNSVNGYISDIKFITRNINTYRTGIKYMK